MTISVPKDTQGQKFVRVCAVVAGSFLLMDEDVFEDSIGTKTKRKVPSLAFLIEHEEEGKLLFDLGIRKHGKGYPAALQADLEAENCAIDAERDIVDILKKHNVVPADISVVIYSHFHWDHIGDIAPFSKSDLVVGAEAKQWVESDKRWSGLPSGQKVHYVDFEEGGATKVLGRNQAVLEPLGSYRRGIDLFHDGSVYLLDSPGHDPGHINALARVGPNVFVLLAADCCHGRLCYDPGERLISRLNHANIGVARETVNKLKEMNELTNVQVVISHEAERLDEFPLFPESINQWAIDAAALVEIEKVG
ncbi:beta-lactamase-like protein [Mycena floridula]|nr:beta-lactamase-like protein [Mycena floridula]